MYSFGKNWTGQVTHGYMTSKGHLLLASDMLPAFVIQPNCSSRTLK